MSIIIVTITLSIVSIVFYYVVFGFTKIPEQLINLFLDMILCFYLYHRMVVARVLATIFYGIGGGVALVLSISFRSFETIGGILILTIGGVYIACMLSLIFVPSVRNYFEN